jgi:glutamine amidotransferase
MWVFRYSSEGKSRSLFFTKSVTTLRQLYPEKHILELVGEDARLVVSEPIGDLPGAWNEVPEAHYGVVGPGEDSLHQFEVQPPATAVAL